MIRETLESHSIQRRGAPTEVVIFVSASEGNGSVGSPKQMRGKLCWSDWIIVMSLQSRQISVMFWNMPSMPMSQEQRKNESVTICPQNVSQAKIQKSKPENLNRKIIIQNSRDEFVLLQTKLICHVFNVLV
mgnify:CR=1 FL=1